MKVGLPKTDVPWADRQWPVLRGCSGVSEGCEHCYAKEWHRRFAGYMGLPAWGSAHFVKENLEMPLHTRKPARVFVAPMSDMYHESVDGAVRGAILDVIERCPEHTFIILTKRPERIPFGMEWPRNVWLGVSAETQERFEERWHELQVRTWGPGRPVVLCVSVEPMLGPVTLGRRAWAVDWVIAGPETGRGARKCEDGWIDGLAKECGVFFDKRERRFRGEGEWTRREWPDGKGAK